MISLQEKKIVQFLHSRTFGKSQISTLGGKNEVGNDFTKHKILTLCTDESGRTLEERVYLNTVLEHAYQDCSIIMPLMIKIGNKFGFNYGKHSLHIVRKAKDCQHFYSLFFDLDEHSLYCINIRK